MQPKVPRDSKNILIVAAEESSALYATQLLRHWKNKNKDINTFGIGNKQMIDEGFEALGRAEELAVVGIVEVFRHFWKIRKTFFDILHAVQTRKPDLIVLMDYPGFNLRLAKKLKKFGIPVVYYISPQVWVWKKKRIYTIKKYITKMIVILPFEKALYKSYGVEVEYCGHPLIDELSKYDLSSEAISFDRQKHGLPTDRPILGLMPGSRNGEISHHLEDQLKSAEILVKSHQVFPLFLLAPNMSREEFAKKIPAVNFSYKIIQFDPFEMIRLTDLVLCASGTATLMVALMEKPMVIMYRMNWLTVLIGRIMIPNLRMFGLVNWIMDKKIVPEIFQEDINPQKMSTLLAQYMPSSPGREASLRDIREVKRRLGEPGVTLKVANVLESYL